MKRQSILFFTCIILSVSIAAQAKKEFSVIAYYSGKDLAEVDRFSFADLTHIIFSFCHLKANRLNVDSGRDSAMVKKLVSLKKENKGLKVMLSLGGWGGCRTCSGVFSTSEGREEFAGSVKELCQYFGTDGIDLDWEYPAIEGFPGHQYQPEDKQNFTELVRVLREKLGKDYVISFAAGGFEKYIDQAVEWKKLMKQVNFVNLMTYDLVNGYSTTTGHHTPLFSTAKQKESTDNAVQKLITLGVPKNKIVIGAAFYGRVWEEVPNVNSGLYQPGKFKKSVAYNNFEAQLSSDDGFEFHWDSVALAPFLYNPKQKLFVSYDNKRSLELKTKYAIEHGLGGIMFWELTNDSYENGLLEAIRSAIK